ncbi:MAG: hypothetical protein M5U27_11860 [Gaiella sp.]|nr:hypothetical protein [Gaiella sp.]
MPRDQPPGRRKQPRRTHRGREGDETRQHQQDSRRGASRREIARVDRPAREDRERGEDRGQRCEVERTDPSPAARADRHGDRDHAGREDGDREAEQQPARREDALAEDGRDGSTRERGADRARERAQHPAGRGAAEPDRAALRPREQRALPAARAVPREPPPCGGEIAPQRTRREHRERDEQRRRLAADEEQPPPGNRRVVRGRAELLRGGEQRPGRRPGLQVGTRPVGRLDEPADLPQPRRPAPKGLHPAVAAVRTGESRRRDEPGDALGDDERPGRRAMVAIRPRERRRQLGVGERVVGGRQEIAEELARAQRPGPHLHDAQPGDVREPSLATKTEDLTPFWRAGVRHPPRAEHHVRREPVHGGEPGEHAADRALPDEDDRHGVARREPREPGASPAVERRPGLVGACGDAEPRGANGA